MMVSKIFWSRHGAKEDILDYCLVMKFPWIGKLQIGPSKMIVLI